MHGSYTQIYRLEKESDSTWKGKLFKLWDSCVLFCLVNIIMQQFQLYQRFQMHTTGPGMPRKPSAPDFPGGPWAPTGPVLPAGPSRPASPCVMKVELRNNILGGVGGWKSYI